MSSGTWRSGSAARTRAPDQDGAVHLLERHVAVVEGADDGLVEPLGQVAPRHRRLRSPAAWLPAPRRSRRPAPLGIGGDAAAEQVLGIVGVDVERLALGNLLGLGRRAGFDRHRSDDRLLGHVGLRGSRRTPFAGKPPTPSRTRRRRPALRGGFMRDQLTVAQKLAFGRNGTTSGADCISRMRLAGSFSSHDLVK